MGISLADGPTDDIHHPENTVFSVHVYARLVALAADDPRQPQLHVAGRHSGVAAEKPILRREDVVPPEGQVSGSATATF